MLVIGITCRIDAGFLGCSDRTITTFICIMSNKVNTTVDHRLSCFFCQSCICEAACPCCLNFDIRINGFCTVLKTIHDLDEGSAFDRSDETNLVGFCHACCKHTFDISALFATHNIRSYIIRGCGCFCTDKCCIRILSADFEGRITELETMSDNDIIAICCIVCECCGHICCLKIFCISDFSAILFFK